MTASVTSSVESESASDTSVTWTSSKPAVATVGETSGLVEAVSAGTTQVTATANDGSGASGTIQISVQ